MIVNEHTVDRILSIVALVLSPFASISLARWLNKREKENEERRAEAGSAVDVFEAHLAAFRMRVEHLESRERELEEENGELRRLCEDAEHRSEGAETQNGKLLRENYQLREDLDACRRGRANERGRR